MNRTATRNWVPFVWLAGISALITAPLRAATPEQAARALAPKVTDYVVKYQLIKLGLPAIKPLLEQVAGQDRSLAFESGNALEWIAYNASTIPADRKVVLGVAKEHLAPAEPLAVRECAVRMLGKLGGDEAVAALAPLLKDKALREVTLLCLGTLKDPAVTQAMIAALPKAEPGFAVSVISALGRSGDVAALSALKKAAASSGEMVRLAAFAALGDLGDAKGAAIVLRAVEKGSPKEKDVATAAYLKIGDQCLKQGKPRQAVAIYTRVLDVADNDPQRVAALEGLAGAADPSVADRVAKLLGAVPAPVRAAAVEAYLSIADTLLASGKPEAAAPLYFRVLEAAPYEGQVVRALAGCGRVGAAEAVVKVSPFLAKESQRVQRAAADALSNISDASATQALTSALNSASPELRASLLAGLVKKAGACLNTARQLEALSLYHQVLDASPVSEVAVHALEGLAAIGNPDSLGRVESFVGNPSPEVNSAAADALLAIADQVGKTDRDKAIAVLDKALEHLRGGPHAAEVRAKLRSLGKQMEFRCNDGIIRYWWVVGPFAAPDVGSWEKSLFPETEISLTKEYDVDGKKYRWQPAETTDKDGRVNLDDMLKPNENVVAYAFADILVDAERDVLLKTGSDDGLICWVNGQRVHAVLGPRSLVPEQDSFKAHLKEGANRVLLKVCEIGGDWEFCLRVADAEGRGMRVKVE